MTIRTYQRESIDSLYNYWRNDGNDPVIIQAPTGSGKSFIISQLIQEVVEDYNARVLVLTHVAELLQQNYDELLNLWPMAPCGLYSAGLNKKEIKSQILFAGIQSLEGHEHTLDPVPNLVLIDECHLISPHEQSRYQKVLGNLKLMNPKLKVVGLTATPYRLDIGWLHKAGDKSFFKDIVYTIEPQRLIDEGYLCNITSKAGSVTLDTSDVHKRGGEFIESELSAKATEGEYTHLAINDAVQRLNERKSWMVFACSIEHANQIMDELKKLDVSCALVIGDTPKAERSEIIKKHKLGQVKCLVNVNVLTTGYNNPILDAIIMMRPTESTSLYVQMIGRGMRTSPGKKDCLVLDYAGVVMRHGPIDAVDPEKKYTEGDGVAPVKECPECHDFIACGFRTCPSCGYEFPPPVIDIKKKPIEAPVLASQIEPMQCTVIHTSYQRWKKAGRPDTVRIVYLIDGGERVNEWISPEYDNQRVAYFYTKFCKELNIDAKNSVTDFLNTQKPETKFIWTLPDGKYKKVVRREYWPDEVPF